MVKKIYWVYEEVDGIFLGGGLYNFQPFLLEHILEPFEHILCPLIRPILETEI